MAAEGIKNLALRKKFDSIKKPQQWLKAVEVLGFRVASGRGGHVYTVRDPRNPDNATKATLVTVIPTGLHRILNEAIFKEILHNKLHPVSENDIWKALGFLD